MTTPDKEQKTGPAEFCWTRFNNLDNDLRLLKRWTLEDPWVRPQRQK